MADSDNEPQHHTLDAEPGKFELTFSSQTSGEVTRGLGETRLAVLGILVAISLGSAALAPGWWARLAAGFGAFVLACFLIRWKPSRAKLMSFAHWLTDK